VPLSRTDPLAAAFVAVRWLIRDHCSYGLSAMPEGYPKQKRLAPPGEAGEFGNWLRLPGRHHKRPWYSRIWDGARWLDGDSAAEHILTIEGGDPRDC